MMNISETYENAKSFAVETAQLAAKKTKQLAAIAKANLSIYAEEDKIKKAELQLGKLYYRDYAVGEEMDSAEYLPWCQKIDESKKLIAELKDYIDELKTEDNVDEEPCDAEQAPETPEAPAEAAPEAPHAREQYGEIFSDLPDYCCVVLVYDTIEYKPNGQMKKLAAVMKDKAVVVSFAKQSERDLAAWISRHFRSYGKGISDELCRYLIFITDGMMTSLGPEIQKVAFYASGKDVTRSDIDAVVIPVLNAQTFDISNAIAGGNYELALRKMEDLFSMEEKQAAEEQLSVLMEQWETLSLQLEGDET